MCIRDRYGGRPEADRSAGPGGTVRFRFFVLHDHVMVVLRPCEAKLLGLRCLTIIGTEGHGGLYAMPSLCGSAEATRKWFRAFTAHSFLTCRPLRPRGVRHRYPETSMPTLTFAE